MSLGVGGSFRPEGEVRTVSSVDDCTGQWLCVEDVAAEKTTRRPSSEMINLV